MDKLLQAGLSCGMSSVAGFHSKNAKRVSSEKSGKNTMEDGWKPAAKDRVHYPTAAHSRIPGPVCASRICIGAWPWGDKGTWHWDDNEMPAIKDAWNELYAAGINFVDTAEAYGDGRSEEIVGELVSDKPRDSVVIQTKWFASPLAPSNLLHPVEGPVKALESSLKRLALDYVDIYLVHGHIHSSSIANVAKGLAECVRQGLARAVGVANYRPEDVFKMRDELARYNIPLAVNQCEYSIIRRYPEIHGHIKQYHDAGIIFQAYSSLAQGRLTGKYTTQKPPPSSYKFSSYPMETLERTISTLQKIGEANNKSAASVALNWSLVKGAVPLVGIRNRQQALDAIGALDWRLDNFYMKEIDEVSFEGKTTKLWQQG
jgi:aryl-alcohol dehydrogenase-like predicted oxidoreductase